LPPLSLGVEYPVGEEDEVAVEKVVDAAVIVPASVEAGEVEGDTIFSKARDDFSIDLVLCVRTWV
jgi:hypothetical protein